MTRPTVDCVLDVKAPLGECPVWCERRQALYWIDIYDGKLNRFDPASGVNRVWRVSQPRGSVALCEGDPLPRALQSVLFHFRLPPEALTPLAHPDTAPAHHRIAHGRPDAPRPC